MNDIEWYFTYSIHLLSENDNPTSDLVMHAYDKAGKLNF